MKALRKLSLLIVTLFFSLPIFAQVSLGVKGGVNMGSVSEPAVIDKILPEFQNIVGLHLGLVADIPINQYLSLQPELNYTQKGFSMQEGIDVNIFNLPIPLGAKATTKVNYLEMPLLAKVKIGNDQVKAYATAGPVLSYGMNGKLTTKAQVLFDIPLTETKLDLDQLGYNQFEFSGAIGAGISFNTGVGEIFVDGRYTHGFTDVYDVPVVDLKLRNSGIALSAGVMIPIGQTSNQKVLYP